MLLAAALGACRGETLYDAPQGPQTTTNAPPPTVALTAPVAGVQVLAGRSVRVQATASDSTLGITLLRVDYSGVASGSIVRQVNPARVQVSLDTAIAVPAGAAGQLVVTATARNTAGGQATTAARSVLVSSVDVVAPTVSMTVSVPARLERTDSFPVHITASDQGGSGIVRVGATALALVGSTTVALTSTPVTISPPSLTVSRDVFLKSPASTALPAGTTVQVYAFAVDSAGNCGAATAAQGSLACRKVAVGGDSVIVADVAAVPVPTTVVAGRTTLLAPGSAIADLVPDATRKLVYMSNLPANRVDVLNLNTSALGTPVLAGSQPWGIAFNRTSDTLIVANSGGTNISYLPLTSAGPSGEALQQRIRTQNADLYRLSFTVIDTVFDNGVRDTAFVRMTLDLFHFSDRPQFIAQDNSGRLVYSTVPTKAALPGTIRLIEMRSGWQVPEAHLAVGVAPLGPDDLLPTFEPDTFGIINVDSMRKSGSKCLSIYDHTPGTNSPISASACDTTALAVLGDVFNTIKAAGSDIRIFHFNTELLTFADTSFVAASRDHRYLAFAEGSRPAGRIVMWSGDAGTFSNGTEIADVVDNTSDHLVALGLNSNGSLGVARGIEGAYYFTNDLRLQGSRSLSAVGGAGAGAAIDPRNAGYGVYGTIPAYDGTQLSYVATANHSIKIFDTVNFAERGEIAIRDNIIGPLRASDPVVSGAVATLYGATDGGGVVVVNVFPTDIHQ